MGGGSLARRMDSATCIGAPQAGDSQPLGGRGAKGAVVGVPWGSELSRDGF